MKKIHRGGNRNKTIRQEREKEREREREKDTDRRQIYTRIKNKMDRDNNRHPPKNK